MTRTDNDTWNLASSVGATATMVAAYRAAATNSNPPLIQDPFAEPLVRAVGIEYLSRLAGGDLGAGDIGDNIVVLMRDVLAARTNYFDHFFTDAAGAGLRQVVIVACGLDARAYRLAWPTGTTVYEIDQPDVIDFKTAALARLGATPNAERRTVAIDLRQDWPTALRRTGFDHTAPTAWLIEGLLIGFLPPNAQDRLLKDITAVSASGSRLAGDYISDVGRFDAAQQRLATLTEHWRANGVDIDIAKLTYPGERRDVPDFLESLGWCAAKVDITEMSRARGLLGATSADLEPLDWIAYFTAIRA